MFNNLHLYAIILIAVLLIIALAVIYLNNKRITSLTQQLKKNTFELSAMQSVIEGHLINGGGVPLHQDIHMTTTPSSSTLPSPSELYSEQSEYYGDYTSHSDGQQYTKSGLNETELTLSTESESSSELLDEEDLTDYDEEDDGIDVLDEILNNFVEDESVVNNIEDDASIVDEHDIIEVENITNDTINEYTDTEIVEENIIENVVIQDEAPENEQDDTSIVEPEKKTKRKRSPNSPARDHDVNTIILSENDDSYYTVYETTTGKKRWRKVKDQTSVNIDTSSELISVPDLEPIPEEQSLNVIDIDDTNDTTTE